MPISSGRCFRLFVDDKLAKHSRIMRETARRARNAMMRDLRIENDKDAHFILMSSMARAVAIGDVKCVRIVMHTNQIAAAMFVVEEGRVISKNLHSFFEILTNAKNGAHPTKSDAKVKKRKEGGKDSAARSMQQWTFSLRKFVLFGGRNNDGKVIRDEIFGARFADEWVKQFNCSDVFHPVPDGLLYFAWKHVGAHGLETLTELELFMRRVHTVGLEFARSDTVFLFVENEIGDAVERIRSVSDFGLFGLK